MHALSLTKLDYILLEKLIFSATIGVTLQAGGIASVYAHQSLPSS